MYTPRDPARSRWHVRAQRTIPRPLRQVELVVSDAVRDAVGAPPEPTGEHGWHAAFRMDRSVFDQGTLSVTATDGEDDMTSSVDVEVAFDTSSDRLGLMVGLTTSVVGIPLAASWRWYSARTAEAKATTVLEAFWQAVDARLGGRFYR